MDGVDLPETTADRGLLGSGVGIRRRCSSSFSTFLVVADLDLGKLPDSGRYFGLNFPIKQYFSAKKFSSIILDPSNETRLLEISSIYFNLSSVLIF